METRDLCKLFIGYSDVIISWSGRVEERADRESDAADQMEIIVTGVQS